MDTLKKMKDFKPNRIVCLTEETVETLYLLGEQDRIAVSYTHLRAHETGRNLVCRLLLEGLKMLELSQG